MNDRHTPPPTTPPGRVEPALLPGSRIGPFEVQRVIARSPSTIVYLAADHALGIPVAIQEYLPAGLVQRDAEQQLHAIDPPQEGLIGRGLRAFIDEARMLARCDHPALVRVLHLCEYNGSAYRVMPFYRGQRLLDLRRDMPAAPDEASLRALLDGLLGALEAIHRSGRAHGGVTPANILLLSDDRPLLLGPGAAGQAIGSDLVESLMASLESSFGPQPDAAAASLPSSGAAADLYALAEVLRFCIIGELPAGPGLRPEPEPLAVAIARSFEPAARPHYSASLLGALEAALAPALEDRPRNAAQFREWLDRGPPRMRAAAPSRDAEPSAPMTATAAASMTTPVTTPAGAKPAAPAAAPTMPPRPHGPAAPPATEPALDPMTIDRAPWVASERAMPPPRRRTPRHRGRQLLMGGALALLATGVVAFATGAWELLPQIRLDRFIDAAVDYAAGVRTAAPPPPVQSEGAEAPMAATPAPAAAASAAAAPVTPPAPVTRAEPAPPTAAPAAAPPTANVTAAPAAPPAPAEPAASANAAAPEPAAPSASAAPPPPPQSTQQSTAQPAAPQSAQAGGATAAAPPVRATPRSRSTPAVTTEQAAASPRSVCAPRTDFALYRCMQSQCQSPRWSSHAQCIRLRTSDQTG